MSAPDAGSARSGQEIDTRPDRGQPRIIAFLDTPGAGGKAFDEGQEIYRIQFQRAA
jgi:hypothetical protein